jgi:hypothetical protein
MRDESGANAVKLQPTRTPELAGVVKDAAYPFYRVLTVTTSGVRGGGARANDVNGFFQ